MKVNQVRKNQRLLTALLLLVMLTHILALTAYASVGYSYCITFSYSGDMKHTSFTKSDTSYSAILSINRGDFNGGSVKLKLRSANGSDLSDWTGPFFGIDTRYLYYYPNVSPSVPMSVDLVAQAIGNVAYISGYFQP